jgi:hypothetical protein
MDDLMISQPSNEFKLWTPEEIAELRSRRPRFWRLRLELSRRSVRCRACGETINSGEARMSAKHLDLASRTYDKVGYVHAEHDRKLCEDNALGNSVFDTMLKEVDDNPEAFGDGEETT